MGFLDFEVGIDVKVERGRITLSCKVEAAKAAGRIHGVIGLNRLVMVKTGVSAFDSALDVHQRIMEAFKRSADLDAGSIAVIADGGK